jgi:hypothetical protein
MKLNQLLTATVLMALVAAPAFAQYSTAGQSVLDAINGILNSPVMLILGLGLAVIGVWTWLVKQETMAGILMIVGGVVLTGIPAIFRGTTTVVAPVLEGVGEKQDDVATGKNTVTPGKSQ